MAISILIMTKDEEANIARCLASVTFSDDVVVLDSQSTDRTVEIAASHGARIVTRPFDDYASQRNYGLHEIPWRNDWVLMLDADEIVPPELAEEMHNTVRNAPPALCLLRMRRKDFLFGTWIRGSGGYPSWFPRLARARRVWVERPINEEYCTDGDRGELRGHLHHVPFNKGMASWIEKHNRYSTMEAKLLVDGWSSAGDVRLRDLAAGDPLVRRRTLKRLVYRLPGRPLIIFLAGYVLRGGFLEGRAGLTFSLLRAWYEFAIDVKVRELRRRLRGLSS